MHETEKEGPVTLYEFPGLNEGDFVKSRCLVTSVRVRKIGGHEHVSIWTRGAGAGTVVVQLGDGDRIAELLLPSHSRTRQE